MIREIKFRAFSKDTKEMIPWEECCFPEWVDDKSIVMMQFTGLKDKSGIDIYEGDIIEATERRYFLGSDKGLQTIRFRSVVVYEDAGFVYSTTQENDSPLVVTDHIKVIGNIYENK